MSTPSGTLVESLGDEHMRRVHGDGSECVDGCDAAPLPECDDDFDPATDFGFGPLEEEGR